MENEQDVEGEMGVFLNNNKEENQRFPDKWPSDGTPAQEEEDDDEHMGAGVFEPKLGQSKGLFQNQYQMNGMPNNEKHGMMNMMADGGFEENDH